MKPIVTLHHVPQHDAVAEPAESTECKPTASPLTSYLLQTAGVRVPRKQEACRRYVPLS